jgi:hypothetical protein
MLLAHLPSATKCNSLTVFKNHNKHEYITQAVCFHRKLDAKPLLNMYAAVSFHNKMKTAGIYISRRKKLKFLSFHQPGTLFDSNFGR